MGKEPARRPNHNVLKKLVRIVSWCATWLHQKRGAQLYDALTSQRGMEPSSDLEALITAYRNAKTSGLRKQILRIYAFRYPIPVLMKLHEPLRLTRYQVKRARKHAKLHVPGTIAEKELKHCTRLDMGKVDHFLEFANRPYFYQDVAYGSQILKLDSGEKIPCQM